MLSQAQFEKISAQMAALYSGNIAQHYLGISGDSNFGCQLSIVANSYQNFLENSALASFLVTPGQDGKPPAQGVQVEGFDSLQVGDWAELEVADNSEIDQQIVQAMQKGQMAELPSSALRRLQFVYASIVWFCDMLIRISETRSAVFALALLVTDCTNTAEIRAQADQLPIEQQALIADVRLVVVQGAKLRAQPTTRSKALAALNFAQQVLVLEYNDKGWYYVEVETEDGFIEGWTYVTVTTPAVKTKRQRGQNVDAEQR